MIKCICIDEENMLSEIEKIICLKKVPIFENLTEEELFALSRIALEKDYKPGETILKEGEPGHELYIIVDGEVEIIKERDGNKISLATIGPFNYLGEMSIFDNQPHSATAIPARNTQAMVLPEEAFRDVVLEFPEIGLEIIKVFCKRLRGADEKIKDLSK